MAAEYYSEELFDQKTFGDIQIGPHHPFIVINATDMDFVGRFDFTQDQFDALGSDVSSFPLGRAVAASSAFPILLTPLTSLTILGRLMPRRRSGSRTDSSQSI